MRIVILGGGIVGANLAKQFALENHEVSLIDPRPEVTRRLSQRLDILTVTGSGTSETDLRKAGIEDAEMLVAVTGSDEVNILACMFGKAYGVKRRIARIRNAELSHADAKLKLKDLGVDLAVHPEETIVRMITQILKIPGMTEVAEFAGGKVLLHGFKVSPTSAIRGKRIADLAAYFEEDQFLIAAILKGQALTIPQRDTVIAEGDTVYVVSSETTFSFVQSIVCGRREKLERVVLAGATGMGRKLARTAEEWIPSLTLIEPDADRAELAAGELSRTVVLNGDPRDSEVLLEAGIRGASYFIALTDDDENNMLASLLARENGARHTICITKNPDYVPLLESIQIDVVLNPRVITASKILKYLRHARIVSAVRLHESDAEVLELEVQESTRVAGKTLRELGFPPGAIVTAILRNGEMEIPSGESKIAPRDKVIVFSKADSVPAVEKLFRRG